MLLTDCSEFYFITHINNVVSILLRGIYCFNQMILRPHTSIADPEIQAARARIRLYRDRSLHDFANLYFCARNRMLQKLSSRKDVAVFSLHPKILFAQGGIVADRHAASPQVQFFNALIGFALLDKQEVFRREWFDLEQKEKVCAELLIPSWVPPTFLTGIHIASKDNPIYSLTFDVPIWISPDLFFKQVSN